MSVAAGILPLEIVENCNFKVLEQIHRESRTAIENQCDFAELHENIMRLEKFILTLDSDQEKAEAILEALKPESLNALNNAYSLWETGLEYRFVEGFLKDEMALSDFFLNERIANLIKREWSLLFDVQPRRVLCIGSGPLPISEIHIHLQTGLPVDCVVRAPDMAASARRVFEKYKFSDSMNVYLDGDDSYDISNYGLIIIGTLVKSKKSILKMLRKRAQRGCQILYRTSDGLRRLAYHATSNGDLRGFHIKAQQIAEGPQIISTRLIQAAANAAADVKLKWLQDIDSRMAAQLLCLINRTLEEETTIGFPGPLEKEAGHALMRQLGADIRSGHRHVLIAEKDDMIVGQLILTPNSSPNHSHIVELTRGTIHPSFRGGGLALRAFREIARKCEELGREVICLDVRAGTMAALWWQHFGFKPYGLLQDYSRVGDKRYKGLYLTQTTAGLKQRVDELAGRIAGSHSAFQLA